MIGALTAVLDNLKVTARPLSERSQTRLCEPEPSKQTLLTTHHHRGASKLYPCDPRALLCQDD